MFVDPNGQFRHFFTRREFIAKVEDALHAQTVRHDVFEITSDGEVIRFVIKSLMLSDGRVIPMVEHPDHLPLLDEVLRALESFNG